MLKYIEKTTDENVTNQNLATIQQFVKDIKSRKEVGINYMKSWELEEIHREEGRRDANTSTVKNLLKRHTPDADIMEIVGCDQTFIDQIRAEKLQTTSI